MPQASASKTVSRTIRGLPRPLARALEAYADRLDVDMVVQAYQLAAEAHQGQKRASGADFVTHAVEVATILAELKLDTASLAAALTHDVVEDTAVSLDELRAQFGEEIATIVDGVTKIGKVRYLSQSAQQVENYRKLLLSMAQDARVILVKLADRLHNMRTLEHLPPEKQLRVARETREIYAPLAGRLGVARIRWELEDLAFKFLEPDEFADLGKKIRQSRRQRERQIAEMKRPLDEALRAQGIEAEVTGRPKHLWSIYRKLRKRVTSFEEIYDLMAMRVMTDSLQSCYAALGIIHSLWKPIPERFHDYVATPKSNMYQSIHTTVVGPSGRRYEVQIRTEEMHRTAEYGIAAHWRYKEGREANSEVDEALVWFRQVLEWQQDTKEPEEFMEFLRMDLFHGEIFVFTPKGEVKSLPDGSTPIDFAFAVHTEVGTRCAGAKVNGRIAPLSRKLKNGDTVEIITNPKQRPSRDWFSFAKTSRARQKIRQWVRKEEIGVRDPAREGHVGTGDSETALGSRGRGRAQGIRRTTGLRRPCGPARGSGTGRYRSGRGDQRPVPRLRSRRGVARAYPAAAGGGSIPRGPEGCPNRGRRQRHGPLRAMLPASPGRLGNRVRHPRSRRVDSQARLPQRAFVAREDRSESADRMEGGER